MADSSNVYGTMQPLQGSVTDWVNNREQMDFAYREEQRKIDRLAEMAKDREQAKKDATAKRYAEIKKVAPTGIGSIDQAYAIYADQAMDKQLELYKKEMSGQTLTPEERVLYNKIESLPETLALMTKAYTEDAARYIKLRDEGKIKRDLDYETKLARLPKDAIAFLDDDLNPALGMDNDGDGQPDIISFDMNGLSLKPNIIDNISLDDAIADVTKTLESQRTVTDQNYRQETREGIPLDVATATAKTMTYLPDGNLTPLAKSYLYDAGVRDFSSVAEDDVKSLEKLLTDRILNSKKRIKESDVDYGAMTAAQRERRQASKGSGEDRYTVNDLNHSTDTSTVTRQGDKQTAKNLLTNNYTGNVNIVRKAGAQNETFRSFGRDKDGNLTVTVDIGKPKYSGAEIERMTENIADPDERQERIDQLASELGSITTRTYTSKGQAGDVMYYVNRFDNPETDQPYKTIREFTGDLPQFKSGGKQETPAERAQRIANGG